jgi:hypothetical protein
MRYERWEYCIVSREEYVPIRYHAQLCTEQGMQIIPAYEKLVEKINSDQAVGILFSKLGEDNWEMVSSNINSDEKIFFFKRPKLGFY